MGLEIGVIILFLLLGYLKRRGITKRYALRPERILDPFPGDMSDPLIAAVSKRLLQKQGVLQTGGCKE